MIKKSQKKHSDRNIWDILLHVPRVYYRRLVFTGLDAVKPKREIYYSTVFALASAAIAFLGQFELENYKYEWLHVVSIVFFGLAILIVILIHFLQTLYIISWHFYNDRAKGKDIVKVMSGKEKVGDAVLEAVYDCFTIMSFSARLDFSLLVTLLVGILSYITFIVCNTIN